MNNTFSDKEIAAQAATFRKLINHLDAHKEVQNIELMLLADFCRNCLSKWYLAEAQERDLDISDEQAREFVYKMPYSQWKKDFQLPATDEQMAAFNAKQVAKKNKQ
jgi:hypothetical protein